MKILLATDGSDYSKAAVEEIARRKLPPGTKVRIVSAYEKAARIMTLDTMGVSKEYYAEADQNAFKAAKSISENAANDLRNSNPDLTVTAAAIEGVPKNVILTEAERFGADLIVVGSHGYGAVKRFLMGSVSLAVALHAKCSVEIIRTSLIKSGRKK